MTPDTPSTRPLRRPLLGALALLVAWAGAEAAPLELGETYLDPRGGFQYRPLAGLAPTPEATPGSRSLHVGVLGEHGPVSVNVLLTPRGAPPSPYTPGRVQRIAEEVAASLFDARATGSRVLPEGHPNGVGFEMQLEVTQAVGEAGQQMFMLQRQVDAPEGIYSLTGYCLSASQQAVAPALRESFDSFRVLDPTHEASPEELVLDASFRFSVGDLDGAAALASRVSEGAAFPLRAAASRVRLLAEVGRGNFDAALERGREWRDLWARDGRGFSKYYAGLLTRGLGWFRAELGRLATSELGDGERAALGTVLFAAWAGPADLVPPPLSERQDAFYAQLDVANRAHPRDDEAHWRAVEPTLAAAAAEVEASLAAFRDQEKAGGVEGRDQHLRWFAASMHLSLLDALRAEDEARFLVSLATYREAHARDGVAHAAHDPTAALRGSWKRLVAEAQLRSVRDLAASLWEISGRSLYARARALVEAEGLAGLDALATALAGGS